MAILLIVFTALLSLHTPAGSATTTDTISPGQQLGSDDKLVSKNGRYALGFFETGSESYSQNTTTTSSWYLGIWFNTVPKLTPAWVANRDSPSFDYPTDTFFPGAKLGLDKVTGLNRRLVSWKNSISPATGMFCEELDPSGANQLVQEYDLHP
ncbi:hypothetical protein E2562_024941 [Oryza meyeriana var. granulata]|uniref:non-specific serine/threonine protein kinase n=1 Tax=Oryza meyeriana var. granulata TaxID=110450 RepID=A0A6G1DN52_9ORYZ|nr:hypothetical protein E2562_024941 [Oryza meyeriana var. granulata]